MGKVNVNDPTQIVISITQNYLDLKGKLVKLASEDDRSLSNYLTVLLAQHVDKLEGKGRKKK